MIKVLLVIFTTVLLELKFKGEITLFFPITFRNKGNEPVACSEEFTNKLPVKLPDEKLKLSFKEIKMLVLLLESKTLTDVGLISNILCNPKTKTLRLFKSTLALLLIKICPEE